uniref:protein-tyrosine-phosphatase n=1 Tax=Callorhinchus milii TaxID=7868 RepID=A0A4W3IJ60_CALMI
MLLYQLLRKPCLALSRLPLTLIWCSLQKSFNYISLRENQANISSLESRGYIDSIIDVSNLPGELNICLIPCTCSRSVRHSWSRLKVDTNWDTFPLKRQCFEDINECINASAGKGKRVLVHCRDGYSLAPTCVIQYLMQKQDMRLINAYELLKAKYPLNIKDCHQDLLVTLEQSLRPGDTHPDCFKQAISRKTAWT